MEQLIRFPQILPHQEENFLFIDTVVKKADTKHFKGNVSATGLIQSGNENRFVASLLSEITIGNRSYQVLPITSIAYSTKPHAHVEGEYLENITKKIISVFRSMIIKN